MQTEMSELQQYKAQLAEKIKENQELVDMKTSSVEEVHQYNRLKEEKVIFKSFFTFFRTSRFQDALLAFREKLGEQLSMIEEAQLKKAG